MEEVRQKATINNWYVLGGMICGEVYGHPKLKDGETIVTSRVARWDLAMEYAYTVNTDYKLGVPLPRSANERN